MKTQTSMKRSVTDRLQSELWDRTIACRVTDHFVARRRFRLAVTAAVLPIVFSAASFLPPVQERAAAWIARSVYSDIVPFLAGESDMDFVMQVALSD